MHAGLIAIKINEKFKKNNGLNKKGKSSIIIKGQINNIIPREKYRISLKLKKYF